MNTTNDTAKMAADYIAKRDSGKVDASTLHKLRRALRRRGYYLSKAEPIAERPVATDAGKPKKTKKVKK